MLTTQPFFVFLLTACSHFDRDCCCVCSEDSWMLLVACDERINACLSRIVVCCPTNRTQCAFSFLPITLLVAIPFLTVK